MIRIYEAEACASHTEHFAGYENMRLDILIVDFCSVTGVEIAQEVAIASEFENTVKPACAIVLNDEEVIRVSSDGYGFAG